MKKLTLFILLTFFIAGCNSIPSKNKTYEYNQKLQTDEQEMRLLLAPIKELFGENELLIIGHQSGREFDFWSYRIREYETKNVNHPSGMRSYCNRVSRIVCEEAIVSYVRVPTGMGDDYRILSINKFNNLTFLKPQTEEEFNNYKQFYPIPETFESGVIFASNTPWQEIKFDMIQLNKVAVDLLKRFADKSAKLKAERPDLEKYFPIDLSVPIANNDFDDINQLLKHVKSHGEYALKNELTIKNLENLELLAKLKAKREQYERNNEILRQKEENEKKSVIFNLNRKGLLNWKNAQKGNLQTNFKKGDSICDYSNKMGFVEDVGEDRVQVRWVDQIVGKPEGFWFGNMTTRDIKKGTRDTIFYHTTTLNRITWVSKREIASCNSD